MKRIKMLVDVTIAGRPVPKDQICELDDEQADGFVNSKLAEPVSLESAEESGEGHHKRKKK
jgi:hypothetical protein